METQEIDLFIEKNGHVQIKVRGVKGTQCLELTKQLEAMLGGQIQARELTPEVYESSEEQVPLRQMIGGGGS